MVSTLYHVAEVAQVNPPGIDIICINSFVKILNKTLLHVSLYNIVVFLHGLFNIPCVNYKQVYVSLS